MNQTDTAKLSATNFAHVVTADILDLVPKEKRDWITFLLTRKGQFMSVSWGRTLKTYKGTPHVITKTVLAVCRAGIDYSNQESVIAKRESGELPAEPQPLPWGKWLSFPYLIVNNGVLYVRLYPSKAPAHQTKTNYFLSGSPSTKEIVQPFCLASEFQEREAIECFTVKLENIASAVEI